MRSRSTVVKGKAAAALAAPPADRAGEPPSAIDSGLLADERFGVLFILWLVGRATVDAIDRRVDGSGLSADEFPVYCLLDLAGPLTPSSLGAWMAAPPTTVSAVVKRMERRGHAVRRPNPADRRSFLLELTDAGRSAQEAAIELFAPLAGQVDRGLGRRTPGSAPTSSACGRSSTRRGRPGPPDRPGPQPTVSWLGIGWEAAGNLPRPGPASANSHAWLTTIGASTAVPNPDRRVEPATGPAPPWATRDATRPAASAGPARGRLPVGGRLSTAGHRHASSLPPRQEPSMIEFTEPTHAPPSPAPGRIPAADASSRRSC